MDFQGIRTGELEAGWLLKGATGADNEGDATGALCDGLE